jgi:RNA polymerase sigma-70 factor (ECF subfamily)
VAELELEPQAALDRELAIRAGRGDASAFEMLVRRHQELMYSVCRRITCDDQDAADALQEALATAWRRIGTFVGRSSVSTWLFRVATNAAIDEIRRRSRQSQHSHVTTIRPGRFQDVEKAAVSKATVDWALAQLPPQYRAAVILREYHDYTYQEIADIMDVPIDTVKSRISRGRQALAELLLPSYRPELCP